MADLSKITLPNNTTVNLKDAYKSGIYTVIGTQTATTGSWTGALHGVPALYDGLTIMYYLPYAGSGKATLNLTLDSGSTTGAVNCYYGNATRLTTHYSQGSNIVMTYWSAGSISIDGTATTDNRWIANANYVDGNTKNTAGSTDTSSKIFLVGATSQAANPQTYSHDTVYVDTDGHAYSNSKQVVNLSDTQALTNKTYNGYTLGTSCAKDVPASGNASTTQVVMGNDTRLSDARTPTSHSHGNIANGGTISSTAVTPANTDYLLMSDTSNSGKIERGVAIGTDTTKYLRNDGTWQVPPDNDTKVTSSANHYTPATATGSDISASASGGTAAWSIDVVQGVTLNTDSKGHVTGLSVTSGKIPGNPNTDTKVRQTLSTTNKNYPLLLSYAESSTTTANVDNVSYRANTIYANPSTGNIQATQLNGVTIGSSPEFTDTKVTTSANHYTPTTATGSDISASASGGTAAWSIDVVQGVTLNTDSKGHVTGLSVTSGKIPANPNSDIKVRQTLSTTNKNYPLLLSYAESSSTTANIDNVSYRANTIYANPSTGNIQATQLNGVTIGSSPKFTDTTYTFANGTNGFTVTPSGGTAQTVTVTPSITNNVTGSGTSGYIAKFNGTNTITNGPAFGSTTTTYLNNAGNWATPPDTKNTAGSTDTSSKIFLIGATSQVANPQTYSDNEVYATSGVLTTKSVQVGGGSATIQYNTTTQAIDFVFN